LFHFLFPNYNEIREHGEYLFDPESVRKRMNERSGIQVKKIMTKFPEIVNEELSVIEAAAILKAFKIKQLPVVNNGNVTGIITIKNLLNNLVLNNLNLSRNQTGKLVLKS